VADIPYTIGGAAKTLPWNDEREQAFQQAMQGQSPYSDWNRQSQQRHHEKPNLDDPQYNYRLAYALGAEPQPYVHDDNAYHWESSAPVAPYREPADLKGPDHATKWMETFMRVYGVDPNEAAGDQIQDAIRRGIIPMAGNKGAGLASLPEAPAYGRMK
jgi:hypothetical protein